jgi:hypothetical protein
MDQIANDKTGEPAAIVSTITLFDGVAITDFDGLPASASR